MTSARPPVALSLAAHLEWERTVENVMRGLAHALSNRATALSAVIELSKDDGSAETVASILPAELERMRELSAVVRTLGPPQERTAAFSARDGAAEAVAVLGLHAEQHRRAVVVEGEPSSVVRVPKWMFVRALIALVASLPSNAATRAVRIAITDQGDWVNVEVEAGDARLADSSPYAAELVRAMGGELRQAGYGFRLPSLAALRKREGR